MSPSETTKISYILSYFHHRVKSSPPPEVKDQFALTIEVFAGYMRAIPGSRLRIEGNCDERGTIEYNLALGQRRADAVKAALVSMGIDGDRIETISYGEERPRNSINSEAGFSVNRRADLISR